MPPATAAAAAAGTGIASARHWLRLAPAAAPEPDVADAAEAIFAEVAVDTTEPEIEAPGPSVAGSMTSEAFGAFLDAQRIDRAFATAVAKRLFPGVAKLDDAQRAQLAAELVRDGVA